MRIFSRWMPPLRDDRHPPWTIKEWIGLAIVAGGAIGALGLCIVAVAGLRWTGGILVALVAGWFIFASWMAARGERAIAADRAGEDIGSFTRGLDRRAQPFDPWVVRAVWDGFSIYANFPLRPTDRLDEFGVDALELHVVIEEVAERSGHSLKNLHDFWEDGATLGDLVVFVSAQPKRPPGA